MINRKQFKPYDRVLVRGCSESPWDIELYSYYNKEKKRHETMGHYCNDDCNILPYEGNEHLVGTTDDPEEEVKLEEGEWIVSFNESEEYCPPFLIGKFTRLHQNLFILNECMDKELAIRISEFNPSDIVEMRKHMLCVKNGKIVRRYKK